MRRFGFLLLMIAAVASLESSSTAQGRRPNAFRPIDSSRVTSDIDRSIQQAMTDAQTMLKEGNLVEAVKLFQSVLDFPEDFFRYKDFRNKTDLHPTIKSQTNWLLSNKLPPEVRAAYELQFGAMARSLLNEALQTNNVERFEEVVSRFQTTSAGFEAMQWLATSAFDHERLVEAAMLCDAMCEHPRATGDLQKALQLRTAYAWYLAGQPDRSRLILNSLGKTEQPFSIRIGGQSNSEIPKSGAEAEWLKKQFGPMMVPAVPVVSDWELPRGGLAGNESASPACPVGGGEWTISPLKQVRIQLDNDENQKLIQLIERVTDNSERSLREDDRPAIPSAIPLIVRDTVVFRTVNDVTAVSLRTGRFLWRSSVSDGMLVWLRQHGIFDAEGGDYPSPLTLPGYVKYKLFRDQLSGSLTSDGTFVYSVEEADSQFAFFRSLPRQRLGEPVFAGPVNKLAAYELEGGRLAWEVGGLRGTPPYELSGIYFLGPPVPYAGRLYCLAEVRDELRLLALVPEGNSVRLDWSQSLVVYNDGMTFASARRQGGLIPTISDGLIVCPTSTGSVVAVDLHRHQLRWGCQYEARKVRGMPNGFEAALPRYPDDEATRCFDGTPLISNGRVVISPRDSDEIYCLDLVDGKVLWHRRRDRGLYVACMHDDHAIVVGKTQIMALSLANGSETWSVPLETADPSGRGVRVGSRYLLPLSSGDIATVDLSNGRILGRMKLSNGNVPGNLAVGSEGFVSLGFHNVVGFRSQTEVESQIARQLLKNPSDPEALALRGELRLHNGDLQPAIDDLRESLRQRPHPQVKRALAGLLLNVLNKNPTELLKTAPELESLTDDPQQRIEYLRLYIRALSESGDRMGAVRQLFRLAASPRLANDPVSVSSGYSISTRQNIRSELRTIFEAANTDERKAITAIFEEELSSALKAEDKNRRVPQFAKLIMGHPAADPILKKLAQSPDASIEPGFRTKLFERLTLSSDASVAAFAVATLAKTAIDNQSRDAVTWIDELSRKFASQEDLDGKTGQQLFDEWSIRKDVQSYRPQPFDWPGQIEVQRSQKRLGSYGFHIDLVSRLGHHFEGWTFELDPGNANLIARDSSTRIAWQLPIANLADIPWGLPTLLYVRERHLALSAGPWLIAMESTDAYKTPRILFIKNLRSSSPNERLAQDTAQNRRLLPNGRRFSNAPDFRSSLGRLIGLSDEALIYQLDNRLNAIELETGNLIWFRIGTEFSTSNATVDSKLVLHTSNNEALVLNALDGSIEQRHKGNLEEKTIWYRGTRRLSERTEGLDQYRIYEMRDVVTDKIVWQSQHPAGTLKCLIEDQEFMILEPSGKLSAMDLETGEVRMTTDTPIVRPVGGSGEFNVHRFQGKYIVVGGTSASRNDIATVVPLEIGPSHETTFSFDGFACACDQKTGRLVWSVPIDQLIFNYAQPANQPLLVFASRKELDHMNQFQSTSRLTAKILDKRNGNLIYETQENSPLTGRGAQIIPMVDERKIVVDFLSWNLEMSFPQTADGIKPTSGP